MQIGLDCFLDEQIRSMIESANRYGECDILHNQGCLVYDTVEDDYLEEYFEEIMDVFTVAKHLGVEDVDPRVDYLKTYLSKWNLFSVAEDDIQTIIKEICSKREEEQSELFYQKVTIRELFSTSSMEQKCILKNKSWTDFCYNIKHVNRFHSHLFNLEQFKNLLNNMVIEVPKGTLVLYRSRICDGEHYNTGYAPHDMGAPPVPVTSAGRTNSEGIQCLYLSSDAVTTFHEARARDNDHVSIGEFLQKKDLKIIDLTQFDKIGPFAFPDIDMAWFGINIEIIRKIGSEIAKPKRSFDKDLDYIPTQYICDYIKYLGYDGIKFRSTLNKDGINYAIFDEKKFKCDNVTVAVINDIVYHFS